MWVAFGLNLKMLINRPAYSSNGPANGLTIFVMRKLNNNKIIIFSLHLRLIANGWDTWYYSVIIDYS